MSIRACSLSLVASLALFACGSQSPSAESSSDAGGGDDAHDAQSVTPDAGLDVAADVTPDGGPLSIAAKVEQGLRVELLADAPLHVGLNRVWFHLRDEATSAVVTHAAIAQHPLMDMGQMKHACPFTNPAAEANAAGLFGGEIVFSMASGAGTWSDALDIDLAPAGAAFHVVFDPLDVVETDMRKMVTAGSATYLVTLNFTEAPAVGPAPFVLTVHEKQSSMSFPPAPEVSVALRAGPSDDALGAPMAVVYDEDGRYDGAIDFTTAGPWVLAFELSKAGATLGTAKYAIEL